MIIGSPSAAVFYASWFVALMVLCPLAWMAIAYDMGRRVEWPRRLKRIYLGVNFVIVFAIFGATAAYAKDTTQPQPTVIISDYCENPSIQALSWWERFLLGCY
jgi:hypothetical protein